MAGDRVGALILMTTANWTCAPKQAKNVLHLINELCQIEKRLRKMKAPDAQTVSTFTSSHAPWQPSVFYQRFSGLDMSANSNCILSAVTATSPPCNSFDPLEEELPPPGIYPISDGHSQFYFKQHPEENRSAFKQQAAKNHNDLKMRLMARNIPFIRFNTATASLATLRTGLGLPQGKP